MYYLYGDLGGVYCERYADTLDKAKQLLFQWLSEGGTFGPFPASAVKLLKIDPEWVKESCQYRLANGARIDFRFSMEGLKIG